MKARLKALYAVLTSKEFCVVSATVSKGKVNLITIGKGGNIIGPNLPGLLHDIAKASMTDE